jgi:hypothetical protein
MHNYSPSKSDDEFEKEKLGRENRQNVVIMRSMVGGW